MARHRVFYSYAQLMNILEGCQRKELVSEVILLALDSWKNKCLSNYAFTAILVKAVEIINQNL